MKKALFLLPFLFLTACSENKISSSLSTSSTSKEDSSLASSPESSSSSVSSAEPIVPEKTFSTIHELFSFLEGEGKEILKERGVQYNRIGKHYETSLYSIHETDVTEEGRSYSDSVLTGSGTERMKVTYDYKDPEETSDTYQLYRGVKEGTYYDIVDYGEGKERDTAMKESLKEEEIKEKTSLSSIDSLLSLYENYLESQIIIGFDDIAPVIDAETGESTYSIQKSYQDVILGTTSFFGVDCSLTFSPEMELLSFSFDYQERVPALDEEGNETAETVLYEEVREEQDITYGTKTEYDGTGVNPTDYFLVDFAVQIQSSDGIMPDRYDADKDNFPYGELVHARAVDVLPEKALDTELTIVSSSDQKVISVTSYDSGNYVRAVGEGTTTLTVQAQNGMKKTIDVTVKAPALESIEANTYSKFHYKGTKENLYIYGKPENSLDEIQVVSDTPELIEVRKDGEDYSLYFKEVGEGQVTVSSVKNPEVKDVLDFHIQEKKTIEEIKASAVGTWTASLPNGDTGEEIPDAATVVFNQDGTGSLTIHSDDTGYTFPVEKELPFTYTLEESYSDDRIEVKMSTITFVSEAGFEYVYDQNDGYFYATGEDSYLTFGMSDPNFFAYTLQLDAKKVSE